MFMSQAAATTCKLVAVGREGALSPLAARAVLVSSHYGVGTGQSHTEQYVSQNAARITSTSVPAILRFCARRDSEIGRLRMDDRTKNFPAEQAEQDRKN